VKRFGKFVLVGGAGFGVDAGILLLLSSFVGIDLARAVSFAMAMLTTWQLNRRITFSGQSRYSKLRELRHYIVISFMASGINLGCFYALIHGTSLTPLPALIVSTALSMFVNFFGYTKFVFLSHSSEKQGERV